MDHYSSRKVAEDYHRKFTHDTKDPEKTRKAVDRFGKFLSHVNDGGHILDAGCGTGRFIPYFTRKGYRVSGIDTSIPMIEIAQRNNPDVEIRVMSISKLDYPPDSFDGVWNSATLLHLEEREVQEAFKESNRVLRRGGCLFIATRTDERNITRIEESTEGGKMTVHYYTPEKLERMLAESGFKILETNVEQDDYSRPFDYVYIYAALR